MTFLPFIPNKRDILARAFGRFGVLGVLEHISAAWRPGLLVLTYHRIAEPGADCFYDPVISATPESFRTQLEWLRRQIRLVTIDELINRLENGSAWREPVAALTFDDGYRDNLEVAAPILRELRVPATFFIPTAFLESPRLPWWDHIAYVFKKTRVQTFALARDPGRDTPPLTIDLGVTSRSEAITMVIRAFLTGMISDERWFLNQLQTQAEVNFDDGDLGRTLFMSWNDVRQLVRPDQGLAVGSHTHSHQKLAGLDETTQREELVTSKHLLEAHLGCEVKALAYPYGWPGTYTAHTKSLTAQAGYRLAFTSREGCNQAGTLDPYEINRLGVGAGDSPALLRARMALHSAFGWSFL
jgi:peptidoglycan/xylan/chitin deacetylase (PgdA/CDA1 family)